jgi:hypothetical protein
MKVDEGTRETIQTEEAGDGRRKTVGGRREE